MQASVAQPLAKHRARSLVVGLLILGSVAAFASAASAWVQLLPRPALSADHRSLAAVVGVVLLVLAIEAASRAVHDWHFMAGAASCMALAAFATYDLATGDRRMYASFVDYIRRAPVARSQSPNLIARWSMQTTNWFATGPGVWLALVAAGLGLIACLVAIRRSRDTRAVVKTAGEETLGQ